jgi:hypothetical protein
MKKEKRYTFDREYLRRSKASTPEQKLNWLAAAVEFAMAKKVQKGRRGR